MRKTNLWLGFAVAATLIATLFGAWVGFDQGTQRERARGAAVASQMSATDKKIMEFVLRRNPDASIRDFSDFPTVLVEESNSAGLDFRLVMALIDKESQFNPKAIGGAGEIGLMQVLPSTGALVAKSLSIPFEAPNLKEKKLGTLGVPRLNLRIGIRFLKERMDEFGGVNATALRAYNRGPLTARDHRPADQYAEQVALNYMLIITAFERGGPLSMAEPSTKAKIAAVSKPKTEIATAIVVPMKVRAVGYHTIYSLPHMRSMTHEARTVRASYVVTR